MGHWDERYEMRRVRVLNSDFECRALYSFSRFISRAHCVPRILNKSECTKGT
jgi:hypothetical protein